MPLSGANARNTARMEDMEKEMETTTVYWCYIGIMEKKMETTVVYSGYIEIMENKVETTISFLLIV